MKFRYGSSDRAGFAKNGDFEEAGIDGARKIGDLFEKVIRLADLIRCLLQAPLRRIDSPIALVNVLLHVSHVIVLEAMFALIRRGFVFGFQGLAVHF